MSTDAHDSDLSRTEKDGRVDIAKLQGDEAELARMGYKQELKSVHSTLLLLRVMSISANRVAFDVWALKCIQERPKFDAGPYALRDVVAGVCVMD
jgi:hypothetical protein